jgi:hypothetical protein
MKLVLVSATALAASILASGLAPARADDTTTRPNVNTSALPDTSSFAAKKDAYLKQAEGQMDDWRHRFDDWSKHVETQTPKTSEEAKETLRSAWAKTEDAGRRLADASEKGWDDARLAFEQASQNFKTEWQRDTGH